MGADDPADSRVMTGASWRELCAAIARAEALVPGAAGTDSPRARAEGYRYLARFLASGIANCVSHDDPDYPVFGRMIDYARPWGLDNPDCLYLYAPLRGGAVYRVWGNRGSANHVDLQVNWGHYANGSISEWGTIGSMDGFELETAADGSFELWIGGERRGDNWLPSADNAEFLLVRQYFADWEGERPADLWIEREGASYPAPAPRTDQIADRLEKLARWLDRGGALWESMSRDFLSMEPNSLVVHLPEDAGERSGMRGQAYGMGHFHCELGEAVIVEFAVPRCHHWGVAVANGYWEAVEYATHQSSLNGFQARRDGDGCFRGVLCQEDPGVPNWLDPAGNVDGTLTARFLLAEEAPKVRFTRLPLAALREALPADTPRVTPEERAASLVRRRRAVVARFRR